MTDEKAAQARGVLVQEAVFIGRVLHLNARAAHDQAEGLKKFITENLGEEAKDSCSYKLADAISNSLAFSTTEICPFCSVPAGTA